VSWGERTFLEIDGLRYGVTALRGASAKAGSASRRVALLHGFAGSSEDWAAVAPSIAAEGFHVLGIDLPGHGGTELPSEADRYGMARTVRDLAAVLPALGAEDAHWHGYSMGGRIALALALSEPGRVASLSLESASPGIAEESVRAKRRAEDEQLARSIESKGIAWFTEHWEAMPIFETQRRLPAHVAAAQRARRLGNRPAGLSGSLRGLGQGVQPYYGGRLSAIPCRALLLAGALDPKYQEIARTMALAIPGAELQVIADAGHNVHLERPEAFLRALLDRLHRWDRAGVASAQALR
jgi:2-succinyl-6-hydroxy-2,4-cyclohexadiene-1-carboxylate synthase